MAREVISASILIIATVVAASAAIMVIIPSIRDLSGSYASLATNLNDKIETDAEIIFIMVNNSTSYVNVTFWVKNTGNTRIPDALINRSDIFIYSDNKYLHFTPTDPEVSYTIENGDSDDYWEKSETLRFAIENLDTDSLPQGEYTLAFVLYNGVGTSDLFSW
ncbi:flagellin [Methermicoccus shengliensis]|uniref:flagellin n=1 Tax=Methermicoccus shengliensis TaxID=660064 RepID=UPI0005B27A48|nr:flagellin [Methermicoccus shengliensis]